MGIFFKLTIISSYRVPVEPEMEGTGAAPLQECPKHLKIPVPVLPVPPTRKRSVTATYRSTDKYLAGSATL